MARGKFVEGAGSTIYCRQMETCFQIGEMWELEAQRLAVPEFACYGILYWCWVVWMHRAVKRSLKSVQFDHRFSPESVWSTSGRPRASKTSTVVTEVTTVKGCRKEAGEADDAGLGGTFCWPLVIYDRLKRLCIERLLNEYWMTIDINEYKCNHRWAQARVAVTPSMNMDQHQSTEDTNRRDEKQMAMGQNPGSLVSPNLQVNGCSSPQILGPKVLTQTQICVPEIKIQIFPSFTPHWHAQLLKLTLPDLVAALCPDWIDTLGEPEDIVLSTVRPTCNVSIFFDTVFIELLHVAAAYVALWSPKILWPEASTATIPGWCVAWLKTDVDACHLPPNLPLRPELTELLQSTQAGASRFLADAAASYLWCGTCTKLSQVIPSHPKSSQDSHVLSQVVFMWMSTSAACNLHQDCCKDPEWLQHRDEPATERVDDLTAWSSWPTMVRSKI